MTAYNGAMSTTQPQWDGLLLGAGLATLEGTTGYGEVTFVTNKGNELNGGQ